MKPADADILLVDIQTKEGRRFAADWSSDSGKILLDCRWVLKSREVGQVLLADENWGGFTIPEGIGEDGDETDEDEDGQSERNEEGLSKTGRDQFP